MPAFIQGFDSHPNISGVEIAGYISWILSMGFESIADS